VDSKYLVQTREVGEGGSRVLVVFAESLRESGDSSLEPATTGMEPVQWAGKTPLTNLSPTLASFSLPNPILYLGIPCALVKLME
jgi:hypothetical protein